MDAGLFGVGLVGAGVIAVVALVVVLIVVAVRQERERKAKIARWAASREWTVAIRPGEFDWISRLPGRNRRGVSLFVSGGLDGRPVGVAEYTFTTTTGSGSSQSTMTHWYLVAVVRLAEHYPLVAVQPRGPLSRLGRSMFGGGETATGWDEFDRQFKINADDPAYGRTLVGPALIGEHLAGRVPAWSLAGQDLMTWQTGRLRDPAQIEDLASQVIRVAGLLGR